jgi:hypothetical protein
MKRKIEFEITIGSYWEPSSMLPEHLADIKFPQGGTHTNITIELETDNKNPMKDAEDALAKSMKDQSYHIWYWTWLD